MQLSHLRRRGGSQSRLLLESTHLEQEQLEVIRMALQPRRGRQNQSSYRRCIPMQTCLRCGRRLIGWE